MKRFSNSLIAIIIATLLMAVVVMPPSIKSNYPDWPVVKWVKEQQITLGLDLQGGTQLDYRIDLRNAEKRNEDDDDSNDVRIHDVIEGVLSTIERRVNGLGVSEPQIYTSNIAGEEHIIVELAGIKDIEEAKRTVGKTIQLEFKEQKTENDPGEEEIFKKEANDILVEVLKPESKFVEAGESYMTSDKKIDFRKEREAFVPDLPFHYKDLLVNLSEGEVYTKVIEGSDGFMITDGGSISEKKVLVITELAKKETKDQTKSVTENFDVVAKEVTGKYDIALTEKVKADFTPEAAEAIWALENGQKTDILELENELAVYKLTEKTSDEKVQASHILISYEGAERANPEVTRTQQAALNEAEDVLKKVNKNPEDFADLAMEFSDGPSGVDGGDLGLFGRGAMAPEFEEASFALKVDEVSEVVETVFGYHIIMVTDKVDDDGKVNVEVMSLANSDENKTKLEDAIKRIEPHDITNPEEHVTYNEIVFDITPDPWKATGLDGANFKYATVTYTQLGAPQVNIQFDSKGADMFAEITDRLVNQRLAIFVGGELISAPNVNEKITGGNAVITGNYDLKEALQLANDLNTGAIDAPIILSGQYTISATLGDNALQLSLYAGILGLIVLMLYMIFWYRLLGVFAVIALTIYSIILLFIIHALPIVMTLAGIAGVILSIGMAVDANILIFERTKEELNEAKNFSASVATGFERAWSSIRDSNVSSLITCSILWFFGNSIIKGFAIMLAIGIIISMFTAITITKQFIQTLNGTKLSKNKFLLGAKKNK